MNDFHGGGGFHGIGQQPKVKFLTYEPGFVENVVLGWTRKLVFAPRSADTSPAMTN